MGGLLTGHNLLGLSRLFLAECIPTSVTKFPLGMKYPVASLAHRSSGIACWITPWIPCFRLLHEGSFGRHASQNITLQIHKDTANPQLGPRTEPSCDKSAMRESIEDENVHKTCCRTRQLSWKDMHSRVFVLATVVQMVLVLREDIFAQTSAKLSVAAFNWCVLAATARLG